WVPRTAGELEARLGDEARARFFSALARLQFGRRAPNLRDWKTICDRAITVLTGPDGSTGGDP
ncbi:MAG: hypothetical protein KDD11_20630, partial [Acidobacteria bacterium]|nr:hypothetical protein [Acidobacteriota bacterium]